MHIKIAVLFQCAIIIFFKCDLDDFFAPLNYKLCSLINNYYLRLIVKLATVLDKVVLFSQNYSCTR